VATQLDKKPTGLGGQAAKWTATRSDISVCRLGVLGIEAGRPGERRTVPVCSCPPCNCAGTGGMHCALCLCIETVQMSRANAAQVPVASQREAP
jgi:hypothetical protein